MTMIQAFNNYFLSGFSDASYFEKRKATYLLYILISALVFIALVTIGQFWGGMGPIYLIANLTGFAGVCVSLIFFSQRKITAAGHIMICSIMMMVAIETIVVDMFNNDPSMRYRLYINFASLLGVYFIILSFFREKEYVLCYAAAFEVILFAHALVIYNQIGSLPKMGMYVIEHFITVSSGMLIIAAISMLLLSYIEALFQQNLEYAEKFKSQNEQLEKMVEERTGDLQSSNKNLREFAYIVSHDLKEPLRTISGFVTLIKKELDKQGLNDGEIEEYINFITSGTRHMEQLINDILTYSKLNVAEKNFDVVDMSLLIGLVKKRLAQSMYESEVELYITDALPVVGEQIMLGQLFENLISNAIKYRSHDRNPKITIGCNRQGGKVRYFVQDNGIGISEKYYETIFKAFRRLHSKIEYEGTGVGLAICKKIVEIHRGEMWVESKEGEGSIFWFTLPHAQTEVPANHPEVHAA
jgi:signal transduction histidine kinase